MRVYSVYDSKAEAYLIPFFASTDAVAMRMFTQAAADPNHNFHQFAADYTLFHIGEWDEEKGSLIPAEAHYNLGNALAMQRMDDFQQAIGLEEKKDEA